MSESDLISQLGSQYNIKLAVDAMAKGTHEEKWSRIRSREGEPPRLSPLIIENATRTKDLILSRKFHIKVATSIRLAADTAPVLPKSRLIGQLASQPAGRPCNPNAVRVGEQLML